MKDYQLALTEQIKNATEEATATVLGVAIGEARWLVHMTEVNEVLPVPKLAAVALTQSWFLGMANVRGNLYGITDLSLYLGGPPTQINQKTRVFLSSHRYSVNSGLLVSNMLGIRSLSDFEPMENIEESTPEQVGSAGKCQDKEGRVWHVLNLQALVQEDNFLKIAV